MSVQQVELSELRRDNPRLLELEAAYRDLKLPFQNSLWREFSDSIDIQNFRGEPGYLSQRWGGMTDDRYLASYDYLRHDETLDSFRHDMGYGDRPDFGVVAIRSDAAYITRDFIDSCIEIGFLWDILHWSPGDAIRVLDIGAGYGRFAYWLTRVFPVWSVDCVDAVPISTFLCDFYLKYRGVKSDTRSIPLHKMNQLENSTRGISVACNMQSFSEMPLAAVQYWLDLCVDLGIRIFFLEPHAGDLIHPHFVTSEVDGSHLDYYSEFERHGYKQIARMSKFPQSEPGKYIYNTDLIMFERG